MKNPVAKTLVWVLIICHFNLLVGCSTGIELLHSKTPRVETAIQPIFAPERKPETKPTFPPALLATSPSETPIPSVELSQPEPLTQERQPDEKSRIIAAAEIQIDVAHKKATVKPAKLGKKVEQQRALAATGVVTNLIRLNASNFKFDPQTKISSFDVTLTNISSTVIFTPIKVTIQNLRPGDISIVNADGGGNTNGAFWDYSNFIGGDDQLSPSETSAPRNWQFLNPRNQRISFLAQIEGFVNSPPRFVSKPVTRVNTGQTYLYPAQAVDPDADSLTYALITGPEGMTIIPSEGTIVWNPTLQQTGPNPVELNVKDPRGGSDKQNFIVAVNRPPKIISTPITAAEESKPYAYDVDAIDPDGDTVTFAFADAPTGMTIDSATGLINWTAKIDTANQPQTAGMTLAPNIAVNPSSCNFGQVSVGASASRSFIITNAGRIALTVSAINLAGAHVDQFKIDSVTIPFTLARGDTQRLTMSFNPTSLGAKNASLQLVSNDPEKATFNAPLVGNAAGTLCFPNQLNVSLRPGETVTRNVAVTLSSCQIKSTFDNDDEGWTVIGDAQDSSSFPTYFSTGGKPGGYVSAKDDVLDGTWYWQAPPKFLGDVSGAYDQTLTFDLRQTFQGTPSQFNEKDVILKGAGLTLVYNTPNDPGADWTSYTVRLNEVAGWRKTNLTGQAPTKAEMLAVLSTLAELRIRGEYHSGSNTGDLDNVTLNCNSYGNLPPVADLALKAVDDPSTAFDEKTLIYSINPAKFPNVNLSAGGTFNFEVTFTCPVGAPIGSSFKLEAQVEGPVVFYQNDFETSNIPVILNCGSNLSQQGINPLYGSAQFVFQQVFTVEAVIINSPGYSDPAEIGGKYAIGMLSRVNDDKLALTFDAQGFKFLNVSLDLSSIDVFGCGGPFGIGNPDLQISLYDTPSGTFSFGNPGTLLARGNATGVKGPNQRTFQWTHNNLTLDASGVTNRKVTLLFDLLASGYAAFDNLVIACSRDLNDVGPSCSSSATVCEVDVNLNCRVGGESRVLVVAQDGRGGMDSQDYSILVNGNSPPQITSDPITAAVINTPYRYDVEAQDFDHDPLTFSLLTFPAGMTIDPNTGLISWLPTQVGTETVEVQVSDGRGGADTQTYLIPITIDFPPRVVAMNPPVTNIVSGAQVILNGSFESATVNPGGGYILLAAGSNAINNWNVASGDIHYIGAYWKASEGVRSVDLDGGTTGSIRQSFATDIGTTYEVRFDMAGNVDGGPTIKPLRVSAAGFSQDFFFDITGKNHSNMGWEEKVFSFTAKESMTTLTFASLTTSPQGWGPVIDNVRVSLLSCPTFSSVDKIVLTLSESVARATVTDTSFTLEQQGVGRIPPTAIRVDSANNTVTFELANELKEGAYTVTLKDAVRDLSGNQLDGEFAGFFPSGDGEAGGDFTTCFGVSVFGQDTGGPGLIGNVYILAPNTSALPSFCSITPVTTILARNLDVPTRSFDQGFPGLPGLFEWFAIRFSGRINIATPGLYTFRLTSDDGTRLFIDGQQIINNDGIHGPTTGAGTITLTKGIHSIVVEYFQGPRVQIALQLFWKLPGQNNFEIVPAAVLDRPLSGPNAPKIFAMTPASGVVGQTIKTTMFGDNLAGTSAVVFANHSGSPIAATVDQVLNDHIDLTLKIPSNTNIGGHAFVLLSSDSALLESGAHGLCFYVLPTPGNLAPIITSDPVLTALVNAEYTYNVEAQDPNNDPLTFSLSTSPAEMTIDPATGLIKWTPISGQEGNHAVTVQVNDGKGGLATQSFTIQVPFTIPNAAPVITSTPLFSAAENELYTYLMTATDADGDFLSYRLLQAPPGMTINAYTGVLQWTPRTGQAGDHEITAEVSDGKGGRAGQIFTIRVQSRAPTNRPPAIISTPATNATQDKLYVYQVEAVDPDQDPIVFDLTVAPAGMTIDPQTGRIEWTPTSTQLGNNKVVARAEDRQSGGSLQEFTIVVSSGIVNLPPEITSSPSPIANPNVAYTYQVNATDPNGDALTFALLTFPSGMQINASGHISWTPTQTQLGDHLVEVQVTDGKGGFAQQGYNLRVQENAATNAAPTITSTPLANAIESKLYTYNVAATDPDGDLLSFSLPTAPTGMTIDFVTGLVQWTPAATQVGNHQIAVRADDGRGGIVTQRFAINVSAQTINLAPSIISTPPLLASPDTPYKYQVQATDPNGDVLTFALLTRPTGMNIAANGLITWTPQNSQLGNHALEVEANDGNGGAARQSYTLTVAKDTLAPVVNIILQPERVNVGKPVAVLVQAVDNVGVASLVLKVGDTPLTLNANNQTIFTPAKAGALVFTAIAKDFSNNQGTGAATLAVIDPSDVTPPRVVISSPKNNDNVTALTDVIGTVFDQNLLNYSLSYAERKAIFQESDFVEFASSTQNKDNTVLGVFDPMLLLNGVYTIRLQAEDINGRRIATFVDVVVQGETKVGNFTLSFTDLSIPVAGLPITITRTYDSRDKQPGDFGFGWRMGIKSVELKEDANRNVTVTLPDGRRVTFFFQAVPAGVFNPVTMLATWAPEPGVTDRLSMLGDNRLFIITIGFETIIKAFYERIEIPFECYEISGYVLTTADGTRYTIRKPVLRTDPLGFNNCGAFTDLPVYGKPELAEVRDLNGNTLKFTADGIIHSSGKSVTFERDNQGRIKQIKDPNGNLLRYGYDDAKGDLIRFVNQEDDSTQFTYLKKVPHHLDKIIDPRGIQPIRNEYDDAGRLVRHIDAFGDTIEYKHNLNARQEIIVDRNGAQRVLEYDMRGNVVRETDPNGKIIDRGFDAQNNRIFETAPFDLSNPHPDTTKFEYKDKNNPTSVTSTTDPEGNTTAFTYNSRSQVLTTKDPKGNVTINTYDAKGNLTETRDALGNITKFIYDAKGNVQTQTDAQSGVTRYEYDTSGSLTKETDALGHETLYTYDANGNRKTEARKRTTPSGIQTLVTTFTYDKAGRLTMTEDPDSTITRTEFDALGKQIATIDKLKRTTRFEYDVMGRLTKTIYPDTTTEEATYDGEGRRLTSKDRDGRITRFEYDNLGRLTKTIYPDSTFTRNVYDAAGRLDSTIDARGKATQYGYDKAGRRIKVIDPLKNVMSFIYDKNGNQIALINPKGDTTKFEYDKLKRLVKTIFPDRTLTETTYDSLGRRTAEKDQAGKITRFRYDKLGRLTRVIDALKQETIYSYDEIGNRITQTDANTHTTTFEYDKLGRETKRTLPDGKFETKRYDDAGNLKTRIDFNRFTTTYEYEKNNDRLKIRRYPDGSSVSFTYKHIGQRASVTDSRGATLYTYDKRNRLKSLTYPDGRKLEYNYDGNGNRTSLKATIGATTLTTTYTYDDASRLDLVIDPNNRKYDHGYDANGNLESLAYPNQTKTTYTYDKLNRLRNLATGGPNNTNIQSYQFTLGLAGNREKIEEQDGTVRFYAYDDLYRLTSDSVRSAVGLVYAKRFAYDAVGNRRTQATTGLGVPTVNYTYDTRDRLLTENSTSYTWDDNGNLKGKSVEATYVWDFENRLIRIKKTDGTIVEHTYDADGNRVRTKISPPTGQPAATDYLIDTSGPLSYIVAETDDTGKLIAYYVRGDELVSVIRLTETRFYHADGLGSIRSLTADAGNITDSYTYSAFGELLAHTGTDPQPYAFTGEPYDPNVGFQYHRARWMDPRVGRFFGMDPWEGNVFDPPSLHRYLYANANPVSNRDPSGKQSLVELAVVATVVGLLYAAFRGLTTAIAGGTRSQIAKAEAEGFLIGFGVAATVYLVIWAGTIAYIGLATGGATFSPQIYNAYRSGHAYVVTLQRTTTVYRYTAYPPGVPGPFSGQWSPLSGPWWATTLYPTSSQAIQELALPAGNTAQYVYSGVIPAGTQVVIGEAAPLFGNVGGGVQIYLSNPLLMNYLGRIP